MLHIFTSQAIPINAINADWWTAWGSEAALWPTGREEDGNVGDVGGGKSSQSFKSELWNLENSQEC